MLIPGLSGRSTNCATSGEGDRYPSSMSFPEAVAITRTERRASPLRERGIADAVGTVALKLDNATARAVAGGARRIAVREARVPETDQVLAKRAAVDTSRTVAMLGGCAHNYACYRRRVNPKTSFVPTSSTRTLCGFQWSGAPRGLRSGESRCGVRSWWQPVDGS
jgi:hypothetical protein